MFRKEKTQGNSQNTELSFEFTVFSLCGLNLVVRWEKFSVWSHYDKHRSSELQFHSTLFGIMLSHFSRVRLCVTPETAAHQVPPSMGLSRQEHWSGLPFPSPMHESESEREVSSVVSDSVRPHRQQPTRLCHPWDSPGKNTGVGCHCFLQCSLG